MIIVLLFVLASCKPDNPSIPDVPVYGDSTTHPYLEFSEEGAIKGTNSNITEAEIPDYFNNIKVTAIANSAFVDHEYLISVTIPNSVTTIGENAFRDSGLESVDIPNSVTSIGADTFKDCAALTTINIDKPAGSIPGVPWGATGATIKWK